MQKFPTLSDELISELSSSVYEDSSQFKPENVTVSYSREPLDAKNLKEEIYSDSRAVQLNSKRVYYNGEYKNSLMEGKGSFSGSEGMYIGEFKSGHINGHGTFYFNNGAVYEGNWSNDARHGFGKMVMPGGKPAFEGIWKDDMPNGSGIMHRSDGAIVEGVFENGFSGVGTIKYLDGNIYRGEFTDGERNGMGVIFTPEGEKFIGQFRGLELWEGILRECDGREYSITNGREIKELDDNLNLSMGFSFLPLINTHQSMN
ncbi:MAG: hypothetical protein HQK84_01965 [Nitrospinae bacterium]|nr:hypothetical protein [Nitrospinota bacterium]